MHDGPFGVAAAAREHVSAHQMAERLHLHVGPCQNQCRLVRMRLGERGPVADEIPERAVEVLADMEPAAHSIGRHGIRRPAVAERLGRRHLPRHETFAPASGKHRALCSEPLSFGFGKHRGMDHPPPTCAIRRGPKGRAMGSRRSVRGSPMEDPETSVRMR